MRCRTLLHRPCPFRGTASAQINTLQPPSDYQQIPESFPLLARRPYRTVTLRTSPITFGAMSTRLPSHHSRTRMKGVRAAPRDGGLGSLPEPAHYVIAQYNNYQRARNFTPRTIDSRHHRLSAFALWLIDLPTPTRILDATHTQITAYLSSLDVIPATRNTYTSYLSSFYTWAVRYDLIPYSPMGKVERAKVQPNIPRPTDDDDFTLALAYARETDLRMHAWLLLAHFEGARCIEIARLQTEDVNRHAMSIRLVGKGSKVRVNPLHPLVLEALLLHGLPPSGHIFRKLTAGQLGDKPLSPATVSRYIGQFMHELGSSATAHRGRHWFATNIHRESGGDLLVVRDLLGHVSTATSEIYTRVDVTKAAPVVGRLSA